MKISNPLIVWEYAADFLIGIIPNIAKHWWNCISCRESLLSSLSQRSMWKLERIPIECVCAPGPQTVIGWETVDVSIASSAMASPASDETPVPNPKLRSGGLTSTKQITTISVF